MTENEPPIKKTDERYDDRYGERTDGSSDYSDQYGNRSNLKVQAEIIKRAKLFMDSQDTKLLRIMDFGAGEGRTWFSTTRFLSEAGNNIHYYATDISGKGLETFANRLLADGFHRSGGEDISDNRFSDGNNAYLGPTLTKENIGKHKGSAKITLVHSSLQSTAADIQKIIPEVDITLCIFGVLSHIPKQTNRRDFLHMFREITVGDVLLTLPNAERSHTDALKFHNRQRAKGEPIGLATEAGDLYYTSGADGSARDFYHVYTLEEIRSDFAAAGYKETPEITIAKTLKEEQLTDPDKWLIRRRDAFESRDKNQEGDLMIENYATYFMVVGQGTRGKETPLGSLRQNSQTPENQR